MWHFIKVNMINVCKKELTKGSFYIYPSCWWDCSALRKVVALHLVAPLIVMETSRAASIRVKTGTSFVFIPASTVLILRSAKRASPLDGSGCPWIRTLRRSVESKNSWEEKKKKYIFCCLKHGFVGINKACNLCSEWQGQKIKKSKPLYTYWPFLHKAVFIHLPYTSVSSVCHCERTII